MKATLVLPKGEFCFPNCQLNGFTPIKPKFPRLAILDSECSSCHYNLTMPYILCVPCDIYICTSCFANGVEFTDHKNDHDYAVFDDNFPLFADSTWTAKDELRILEVLREYGNFSLIPRYLPHRTFQEIQEHYDHFYLQRKGSSVLPEIPEPIPRKCVSLLMPYRFKLNDADEPPRCVANSSGFNALAGYNAARSEFEVDYDSNAEDIISNLKTCDRKDQFYKVIVSLQCAIVQRYDRRLMERWRRKCVIRNHGLILIRKMVGWLHRYHTTITKRVYERICRFLQFYTGMQFEYLMEGFHRAGELKTKISKLCEFHKYGITTLQGAKLYVRLKNQHELSMADVKAFQANNQFNWKIKPCSSSPILLPIPLKKRGSFSPLEVVGLPGYEKLSTKEQELCRNVRLVPLSYLEFRDILMNENRKAGHLKLQTARRLLKIDVNKTRRLYDFLVEGGYINKQ